MEIQKTSNSRINLLLIPCLHHLPSCMQITPGHFALHLVIISSQGNASFL